jgi:hypothetical protein
MKLEIVMQTKHQIRIGISIGNKIYGEIDLEKNFKGHLLKFMKNTNRSNWT